MIITDSQKKFDTQKLQKELKKYNLDGWLAIDFKGRNEVALQVLQFPSNPHITRRWAYWVPANGTPQKLTHVIEEGLLDHLDGDSSHFLSFEEFSEKLKKILNSSKKIALESSTIPSISFVDGGTIDLIRSFGVEPVSSQDILQPFLSVLTIDEIESQKRASIIAENAMQSAWDFISKHLEEGITELDVQTHILNFFQKNGCSTDWKPIVATNAHSALPHYESDNTLLKKRDFILIDLGCREPHGVCSDITRVAIIKREPTKEEQKIFSIVKKAQDIGIEYIIQHANPQGLEVDQAVRAYMTSEGYGAQFVHRLGHNITTKAHGPGAHLDSLETKDSRLLIENTCFSIEPGIYIRGQFGIRLESTILLLPNNIVLVTGGIQQELKVIL